MANICTTEIHIYGESVSKLHKAFVGSGLYEPNAWVGNFIEYVKIEPGNKNFTGWIDSIEYDDMHANIVIHIDSHWSPPYEFMSAITDKFPELFLAYYSCEPGCEIYETNSFEEFPFHWIVWNSVDGEDAYFLNEEDADKYISDKNLVKDEFCKNEIELAQ